MVLFTAMLLLTKSLTIVLIGLVSKMLVFTYFITDLGLYIFVKILRDDFYYWIPVDGFFAVVLSFLFRIAIKFIADFSGIGKEVQEVVGMMHIFLCFMPLTFLICRILSH